MILQQLTIEATDLSDQLWLAQVEIEVSLKREMNNVRIANLVTMWTRLETVKKNAMKRLHRRLNKQVDADAFV